MTSNKTNNYLNHFLWNDSSLYCLLTDRNGIVKKASVNAEALFGDSLINKSVNDIFIYFDGNFDISNFVTDPGKKHILNISTKDNLPESFYFNFYEIDGNILAIGELNTGEIQLMKRTLIETNNELNNVTRQLHKKNEELIKINKWINKLLSIASHDLRNPIASIQSVSSLLVRRLQNEISSKNLKLLETIRTSSIYLLNLLNDLLDISTIESGNVKLNLEKTNIVEQIRQCIDLNRSIASKKRIEIQFEPTVEEVFLLVDRIKMNQVINNLISNAIKFSFPENHIQLSVQMVTNDVLISVLDHGQGIPQDEVADLFKPFYRTSVRSTENEKDTGLGLSIVYGIVERHGGKAWIKSEVGKGTVVCITLPKLTGTTPENGDLNSEFNNHKNNNHD